MVDDRHGQLSAQPARRDFVVRGRVEKAFVRRRIARRVLQCRAQRRCTAAKVVPAGEPDGVRFIVIGVDEDDPAYARAPRIKLATL